MTDPNLTDPRRFERVYREHRAIAFAVAVRVLDDAGAAEEVVQDCFAQLWTRPQAFDARRGPLRTYIAMLARSRAIDRTRSQAARDSAVERLGATLGAQHDPSAAERAIERERSANVVSLVDRLPDAQREAVLLAFGRELTATEIAHSVGIPLGTAKGRVRLGLARLRAALEDAA
jgi:RNA polymerase sigma-70 factor (ECF subfamily)